MRKIYPEDLTFKQIHYLISEKRRVARSTRLENFHRTGRVIPFVGEANTIEDIKRWSSFGNTKNKHLPKLQRTWLDRILLTIEPLALVGFISIVISVFSTLGVDGHTPPNAPGGARPNEAEIPKHLRSLWQSLSNLPTPIPAADRAIRIQIPAMGVDAPVVQGDGWEQLKKGVGQKIGTPDPGKNGNIVLSGHNDVYGEVFRYLDRLSPGESIIL